MVGGPAPSDSSGSSKGRGAVPRDSLRCLRSRWWPATGAYGLAKRWCASGRSHRAYVRDSQGRKLQASVAVAQVGPTSAGGRAGALLDASRRRRRRATARHTDRKRRLVVPSSEVEPTDLPRTGSARLRRWLDPERRENDSGSSEQAVARVRTPP